MRSITAVEIGADICALARTSVSGGEVHLWAAETLDPAAFPGVEAFTLAVRQSRRTLKLPRSCRAVVWGLPDGARRRDPIVGPLIEPLTKAGFRVSRVVTPCNALGALARLRVSRTGGAMCWLGINRNGVAIVVVRPGKLLYSHSFAWDSNVGASGSQARLLQRYSLVAFLAPEVRRALAAARQKGTTVDGIITCGNLPDLRQLTMPLIEELDIEVETLDSLEGLVVKPEAADKLSDAAPALRLACAGAIARETRSLDEAKRRRARQTTRAGLMLRVAALLAVVIGAAYWFYWRPRAVSANNAPPAVQKTTSNTARPPATQPKANAAPPPAPAPVAPPSVAATPPKGGSIVEPGRPSAASPTVTALPSTALPSTAPQAATPKSNPLPPPSASAPKSNPVTVSQAATPPPAPAPKPVVTPPPAAAKPATKQPTGAASSSQPPAPAAKPTVPTGTLSSSVPAADKPVATRPVSSTARPESKPMPALLTDPVPRVTAILVSPERRFATIGDEGQIIGVGATVGRRVVVAIDDQTVLFREPSGVQIRVGLGGRVVGVERDDR